MRRIGALYPIERFPIHRARFYWENQRFAKRDHEGRPGSGLSLAFPEVPNHWLQLLREALQRGADGISLYLNRCAPPLFSTKHLSLRISSISSETIPSICRRKISTGRTGRDREKER